MYNQTFWENRVTTEENVYTEQTRPDGKIIHTPYEGEVIVDGTPQDAPHFNNNEVGTQDAHIATQILLFYAMQNQRRDDTHQALMDGEVLGETKDVTLTNKSSFPFNSTIDIPTAVNLTKTRKNLFYTVETEVKSHEGEVGEIVVTNKALNGFKIGFNGAGSKVVVTVRVKGGMT